MTEAVAADLARELLAIHEESYGVGVARARVHELGDDIVVFLDGIELQRNERFLIEQDRPDLVLSIRAGFQQSIAATFRAAVERVTGRTVTAFLSSTSLATPPFSVEVFRLAPRSEPGPEVEAMASGGG